MASPLRPARFALALVLPGFAGAALAAQDQTPAPPTSSTSRVEASQIELPARPPESGPGRAYLDEASAPRAAPVLRAGPEQVSRGDSSAPASQITARAQSGPGMAQLSRAELDATLAQLTPAERRVLLQAIEGSDICDNPPQVAAILTLCVNRIETRSREFAARPDNSLSAEERLLWGDLDPVTLPTITQVIARLARGNASSEDFDNQAIAAIVLGTGAAPAPGREEERPERQNLSGETQSLVNALVNQLGGRSP